MYHAGVIVDLGVRPTRPLHYVHIKTLHLDGRDVVARPIIIIIFCLFSPVFLCLRLNDPTMENGGPHPLSR